MDLQMADYWDRRAETYAQMRRGHLHSSNFKDWKKELKEKFPKTDSPLKILDIGTATGYLAIVAASLGHHVTAIDISPRILKVAAREASLFLKEGASLIRFTLMDAQQLDFPDRSFDVVMTRNASYCFNDASLAYRECYRVLKPGGVFLNYDSDNSRAPCYAASAPEDPALRAFYLEADEMRERLSISYVKRPEWDVAVLRDCGFAHCESDKNISRKFTPHGTGGASTMFLIYAVKPLPADSSMLLPENQAILSHMLLKKREERFYIRFLEQIPLPESQYSAMQLLYLQREGLRPSDIAQHLLIPRQTMTHLIHTLTKQEYVCSIKNPKDGRSILLNLTPKGISYFENVSQRLLLLEQEALRETGLQDFLEYTRFYEEYLDKLYEIGLKYNIK